MTDREYGKLVSKKAKKKDTPCARTDCQMYVTDARSIKARGNHCRGLDTCEFNGTDCPFYKKKEAV